MKNIGLFLLCLLSLLGQRAHADPPFSGTIFIDPDIITAADPTAFISSTYAGQGMRTMYDRRVNAFITVNAYLFNASFNDGLSSEVQVNPEFGSSAAAGVEANKYATVVGRLPNILRSQVQTFWIHMGTEPFGGGNNNLLIHTGQTALYEADGILEETFVHEASHTSLDAAHASSGGWLAAQTADPEFISTYARDNPTREDIAETFLTWLAVRHRASRITPQLASMITSAIPNRLAYFDAQNFDLYPMPAGFGLTTGGWVNAGNFTVGTAGNTANTNNWPATQSPDKATDTNLSTKYLLFKVTNAALGLRPVNASLPYNQLAFTTAEDAVERDPASYQIYGSAAPLPTAAGSNVSMGGLTLIASGALSLPAARNAGPTVVTFPNTTAYAAYLVVFPTVKNAAAANSTQIEEVALLNSDTQPPTSGAVTLLPASPVDAGAALTVNFELWTDQSPPLSYAVRVDGVVVSPQGPSTSRNFTGPAAPGTHSLDGVIYDALGNVIHVFQNFTVNTALQSWRKLHFGTTANVGAASNLADFELDGLLNVIEFAFGLNPKQSSSAQLPQAQMSGGNLFYSFTQPAGVSGILYGAEWSTTLAPGSWTPITDTGTPPQHLFSVPIAGQDKLFIRLTLPSRPLPFSSAVATFQQAAPYVIANSLLPNVEGWGVFGGTQTIQRGYFNFSTLAYGDVLEIAMVQNFGTQHWIQQFEIAVTTDAVPNTAGGGTWTAWVPTTLNSTSTTLSLVSGTNIRSSGNADTATYTLRGDFPLQGITGVRLTAYPYDYDTGDALPATLGRSYNGNFVLSEFKATAAP